MRVRLAILFVCAGVCSSGCELVANGARNLVFQASLRSDEVAACLHDRAHADAAWHDVERQCPGQAFSNDYVRGFKAGFIDGFNNGGAGRPVPVPPPSYWKRYYQTAEGHRELEDWFAGFRHGAAVAHDSPFCPRVGSWNAAELPAPAPPAPVAVPVDAPAPLAPAPLAPAPLAPAPLAPAPEELPQPRTPASVDPGPAADPAGAAAPDPGAWLAPPIEATDGAE